MPRRTRNSNFLPGSPSSSSFSRVSNPLLDQQNVELAENAESLERNTCRRLAPTTTHQSVTRGSESSSSSGIHPSSSPLGTPARTMPEEYVERLNDNIHQANLGLEGQSSASSDGGRHDSGGNAVTPLLPPLSHPLLPPLSEDSMQSLLELLRSYDMATLQYEISLVVHDPEVDEGDLEDWEYDGHEDMNLDVEDMYAPEVDEGDLEDSEDDAHEDMRLFGEDMSYEELLALGEAIGNAEIGLSEDAILAGVVQHSYQSPNSGSPEEKERCCICLEDYVEGEELGKLDCDHEFHFNCVEQWLMQKNTCPQCKRDAVSI